MPFPLSLNQSEYETLVELARQGTLDSDGNVVADKARVLDSWLKTLEQRNGITRYAVWVQWQEMDAPLPAGAVFPDRWPPELRYYLALVSRPINRGDVDTLLKSKATKPTNILITRDPAAIVGWTEINKFFK